jgi:CubicO group peptidase (beta-lactamase class C family)
MKRIIVSLILILIVIAGLLITFFKLTAPSFSNLDEEMEYIISNFVKENKSIKNCVLSIMKDDGSFSWSGGAGIAYQDTQLPMTENTPIYIASVTKLYTATVTMRLYEEGRLSLNDPISKYLPEKIIQGIHVFEGKDYSNKITIKHLISHTSGIADYYSEKDENGENLFEIFLKNPERLWTINETIERVRKDLKPNFQPGTDTSYSDTNYQLLGRIIESITGKPLHIVFENYLFHPLGLKQTWLVGQSRTQRVAFGVVADVFLKDKNINKIRTNGSYWADGGIVSTANEMIIFLKALNDGKIIRKETLKSMHNWRKLDFPLEYGYGTMYFNLPPFMAKWIHLPPLWGHSGSTGSFLYYSKDQNIYLAGSINQAESESKPFFGVISKVIKAVESKNK